MKVLFPDRADPLMRDVLALSKRSKDTVGFLADEAFKERAQRGTLAVAVQDGKACGYALYSLPRHRVSLVHLVVTKDCRGQGIARLLVDAVAAKHSERQGIWLSCRNDFEAAQMWRKLDFIPMGERPGRSIEGLPLTMWFRSFGHPDLFADFAATDTRPLALLEACVFFDAVSLENKPVAQQLRADWLGDHVRLGVTAQVMLEIHKNSDPSERERERLAAQELLIPHASAGDWRAVQDQVVRACGPDIEHDQDDLAHVARAVAAQADWLISTDNTLANRYQVAASDLGGLRVVTPAEFMRETDRLAQGDRYRPEDLGDTDVTKREVDAPALAELAHVFVHHRAGEKIGDLQTVIDRVGSRPDETRMQIVEVGGALRGLVCWEGRSGPMKVLLLRTTGGTGENTLARQMLGLLREEAVAQGVETILITDKAVSVSFERSYEEEGFARCQAGVRANPLVGAGSFADLVERASGDRPVSQLPVAGADSVELMASAAAAERWHAPYRVLGAGIPCLCVPIKYGWASALFESSLTQDQLFSREWSLGLRREQVYYRNPRNARGLAAPARLLWYVSGPHLPGGAHVRATSQLLEVSVDEAARLYYRFKRLGIYRLTDVRRCADKGRVMALRFSQTQLLDEPVPLADYLEIMREQSGKTPVLQSVHPVSEHVFAQIVRPGDTRA